MGLAASGVVSGLLVVASGLWSGVVTGLRTASVGWALWRGVLPPVDSCVWLLVAAYESRWSRRWVLLTWGCAALFSSAGLVVFGFDVFWVVLLVVVTWVGLLVAFVSQTGWVAPRLVHRVRTGLEGPSPLVRGWAAAVWALSMYVEGSSPGDSAVTSPGSRLSVHKDVQLGVQLDVQPDSQPSGGVL